MTSMLQRALAAYDRIAATKSTLTARDVALLAARIALAWDFVYHGTGTLFGAFGGAGLHNASIFYGTVAHLKPGGFFAVLGGSIEFAGGVGIGLGILGRLAGAGLVGDMTMAMITVTWHHGIVSGQPGGGYELNLVLAALAAVVMILGTGRLSLDRALAEMWNRRRSESHSGASSLPPLVGTPSRPSA